MKNQLPTRRPSSPGGPIPWGYRSRPFERERVSGQHVEIEIAVYRVMLWPLGAGRSRFGQYLMYQRPTNVYSAVLN